MIAWIGLGACAPEPVVSEPRLVVAAPAEAPSASPVALVADDGTALRLARLDVRSVVQDPLVFTEVHLTFENPVDRAIEGHFAMTLPAGASVSRFAMKVGEAWQEGEVVEKARARSVYEDFLHRRQDPALLEKAPGNVFQARVFPIPASGTKELVLSYAETFDGAVWTVPLAGLPVVDRLDAVVRVDGGDAGRIVPVEVHQEGVAPGDLVLTVEAPANHGVRDGDLVAFRVRPNLVDEAAPIDGLTVLFDTSGSRALGYPARVKELADVVSALHAAAGDFPLDVLCFDQEVAPCFSGTSGAFVTEGLVRRGAFGASDLARALDAVDGRRSRVLLVGDGVVTAGAEGPDLKARAAGLGNRGVRRIDALVPDGLRDDDTLRAVVHAGLPRDGVVIDATATPSTIAGRLLSGTAPPVEVHVDQADFVWPDTLRGLQSGDDVVIVAHLPADAPLAVTLDGAALDGPVALTNVARPLLDRAVAAGRIARLESLDPEVFPEAASEIVALSVKHRVLSDATALLVLESESDFDRYGIDRAALTDVLVVGEQGVEVTQHERIFTPARESTEEALRRSQVLRFLTTRGEGAPAVDPGSAGALRGVDAAARDPWSDSASDVVDIGRAGGGSDLSVGAQPSAPVQTTRVEVGEATFEDADVDDAAIVKVVRKNSGQLKYCYEMRLRVHPELAGRVEVTWTVSGGRVREAELFANTTGDSEFAECIVAKIKRWVFPPDAQGDVMFPFLFRPGDARTTEVRGRGSPGAWVPGAGTPVEPVLSVRRPRVAPEVAVSYTPGDPPTLLPLRDTGAWEGRFAEVMALVSADRLADAEAAALAWHEDAPGDALALVALGEIAERDGRPAEASRRYGSLIDLFPGRADLRRMAGERLERVAFAHPPALDLAIDTFRRAAADRPDHPSGHRLLAYALVKAGRYAEAFDAIEVGAKRPLPSGRFAGVDRILRDDAGLIGALYKAAAPAHAVDIDVRLLLLNAVAPRGPSVRFVMSWETDANDVDFHLRDAKGGHAWYVQRTLPSGGELYADVTTGYGPECFAVDLPEAGPYAVQANYFRQGPMGFGMGKLAITAIDAKGRVTFDERPYVIQRDGASVDLGAW